MHLVVSRIRADLDHVAAWLRNDHAAVLAISTVLIASTIFVIGNWPAIVR